MSALASLALVLVGLWAGVAACFVVLLAYCWCVVAIRARHRREQIRLAWDRFNALTEGERRRWVRVRFGAAIDAAQLRNAKPAPRVSGFPRRSER